MSHLITGILDGAPLWVWPLLAGLIWLGLLCARDRTTAFPVILALPLLGALSLDGIGGLPAPDAAWRGFAVGYALGAALGFVRQRRWVAGFDGDRVRLRGEWFTLTVLMVTFWSNFVGGTVQAISPQTYASPGFVMGLAACIGAAGGTFLGRSARVIALWRLRATAA